MVSLFKKNKEITAKEKERKEKQEEKLKRARARGEKTIKWRPQCGGEILRPRR